MFGWRVLVAFWFGAEAAGGFGRGKVYRWRAELAWRRRLGLVCGGCKFCKFGAEVASVGCSEGGM